MVVSPLQSLLSKARGPGTGSSSRRVALFKNVEPAGKSMVDSSSRRQQTPLVNFNPFTPDSLLIQSATQQRNNRKRSHWNEYVPVWVFFYQFYQKDFHLVSSFGVMTSRNQLFCFLILLPV